jgi:hypothetical protein
MIIITICETQYSDQNNLQRISVLTSLNEPTKGVSHI